MNTINTFGIVYEVTPWEKVVEKCSALIREAEYHETEKIRANLELGKYVDEIRRNSEYGDNAVRRLASELTARTGRTIYPQRLYEACEVYRTVGTMEKVREIAQKRGEEVTWGWLVRYATRRAENERDPELREEKMDRRFARIEHRLESAVNDLAEFRQKKMTDEERESLKGLALSAIQTIESVFSAVDQSPKSSETQETNKTDGGNNGNGGLSSEVTEKNAILLGVIDRDEITGARADDLEIHDMGGGDIDTSVVVCRETHRKIHRGLVPISQVVKVISARNRELARKYLELLSVDQRAVQ